jgi:hypothetical protein
VDAEDSRHVAGRRKPLAGPGVTLRDVAPYLRGDLLVQRDRLVPRDLDFHNGDSQSITITTTEIRHRAEPAFVDHDLVIREARRRQRRRRLWIAGIAFALVAAGTIAATAMNAGRSGSTAPGTRVPPATHVPAATTLSAGPFHGTWHAHTTSIVFAPDGTGIATWPGPVTPGGSEATAVPNRGTVRLTAVHGETASGVVSGSTDRTELPDGPIGLRITPQDLLVIVPSQPVAVTPLRWTALCGSSAAALTVSQQVAEGINCGA